MDTEDLRATWRIERDTLIELLMDWGQRIRRLNFFGKMEGKKYGKR